VAGPEKKSATAQDAGRNCPYCRFALKEGADAMVCGACMAPHHLDCWTDNGGCAVMGCAGGPTGTGATPGTAEAASRTAVPGGSQTPPPQAPPPATAPPAPSGGSRGPQLSIAILVLAVAILGVAGAIVLTKGSSPRTPAQQPERRSVRQPDRRQVRQAEERLSGRQRCVCNTRLVRPRAR